MTARMIMQHSKATGLRALQMTAVNRLMVMPCNCHTVLPCSSNIDTMMNAPVFLTEMYVSLHLWHATSAYVSIRLDKMGSPR